MSASTCLKSTKIHALVANSSPEEPAITRTLSPTTKRQPISISRRAITWKAAASRNTKSPTSRAPAQNRDTTSSTGRGSRISVLASTPIRCSSPPCQERTPFDSPPPDVLEKYVAGSPLQKTVVSRANALEELFFLGLRLNRGVDLREVGRSLRSASSRSLGTLYRGIDHRRSIAARRRSRSSDFARSIALQ